MSESFVESQNFNPSSRTGIGGALRHLIKYISHNLEGMVAAKIVKYDRNTHIATVLPLVNIPYVDGVETKYAENEPFDVSVMMFCHGGFLFDMPLAEGDTGWVIAADRDTTLAKQNNASVKGSDNNGTQRPNSLMRHKYSQGFFIPDSWAKIPFDDEKFANKFVIGDIENVKDPSAYLTIDHDGNFLVHADDRIDLLSKLLHISGDVEADGSVEVKKDLNVGGDANVSGNLTVDGQQNRINDCTENDVEIVKAENIGDSTVLHIFKTKVFRSELQFVRDVEIKQAKNQEGDKKESGEDTDTDTVIVAPFMCRRVVPGNSEIMFFLPSGTATVDGKEVDFSTNFNTVSGGWKKANGVSNNGSVYCYITCDLEGSCVAKMKNTSVEVGSYENGKIVVCCFEVAYVTGLSTMSVYSGIDQMVFGTLFVTMNYVTDERSITADEDNKTLQLKGFTKFKKNQNENQRGTFDPSESMQILEGVENGKVAFLVRDPNDENEENSLKYKTLKIGHESCFQYKITKIETEEGREESEEKSIVNNNFYWDGVVKTISDYTIADAEGATIYLTCSKNGESAEWEFAIATTPVESSGSTHEVFNYKLYEFDEDGNVSIDYRTTFLALPSRYAIPPDRKSIDEVSESASGGPKKLEIKGFKDTDAEDETLVEKLGLETDEEGTAEELEVIARTEKDGELKYIPLGIAKQGTVKVDDKSINRFEDVESGDGSDVEDGSIQIKGWNDQDATGQTLAEDMGFTKDDGSSEYEILARKTSDKETKFVPYGKVKFIKKLNDIDTGEIDIEPDNSAETGDNSGIEISTDTTNKKIKLKNSGVRKLNDLTGEVTLVGNGDVTITKDGNSIKIGCEAGSSGEEKTVTVLTGISFDLSNDKISFTLKTREIKSKFITVGAERTGSEQKVVDISSVDLVDHIGYNENGNYQIADTKKSVKIIGSSQVGTADTPIETTPLQNVQ